MNIKTTTRAQQWGNSIGVRLSARVAARAGITVGNILAVSARNEEIVLVPQKSQLSIDDRIRRISKKNLNHDTAWLNDRPLGKEIV